MVDENITRHYLPDSDLSRMGVPALLPELV